MKMRATVLFVAGAVLSCATLGYAQLPVTSGLELWLDAADASTFSYSSGTTIATWSDKANSHHATPWMADVNRAPVRNATAFGGLPAVRFDGANDGLSIAGAGFTRPYTVFTVDQYYGAIRGRTLQSASTNWLVGKWANRNAHYATNNGGWVYFPAAGAQSTAIGEATGNPTSSNYFVNGSAVGGNAYPTASAAPTNSPGTLGLVGGGAFNEQSQADVAEVLWYNRVLDPFERQQVGEYLQNKWGIAGGTYNSSVLSAISQGGFTGSGPGEGLDLEGHFQYAVNVRGPAAGLAGDANFTDEAGAGVTVSAANEILNWHAADYDGGGGAGSGSGPEGALETVMRSIRWNGVNQGDGSLNVLAPGLMDGQDYRLQLLFAENCCARGFDVSVEGLLVADEFSPQAIQGGNNTNVGAQLTVDFFADGSSLDINLNGRQANFGDRNPILNGFTLEFFPDAVASTSVPDGGTIDFSADLVVGPDMDTQTLTITNTGEALSELVLNDLILTGDPEFSVTLDDGTTPFSPGTTLAQGEMLDLLIHFDGSDADIGDTFAGLLELDTNSGATFGSLDGQNFFFNLNAVVTPEPTSIAVWTLLGLIGLGWWRVRGR